MSGDLEVTRQIAAPPAVVWGLVSDLARMGEWSNENTGGRWLGEAVEATPGARFKGSNRNGMRRWSTVATVEDAAPDERLAFSVSYLGIPISSWSYDLESTAEGCRVTETWSDRRPGWFRPLAHLATGVADRESHTRAGMSETLDRLAAAAEG